MLNATMSDMESPDRRRFLAKLATTMAAARLGMLGTADAKQRESRELAALGRGTEWLNSPRLTAANLVGKVVLVDFCTYTCINWLRTLPYVRTWSQKYGRGLVLIGVHTPEFAFEKNLENVRRAVQQLKIDYPIAIDNDYSIWRAFSNQYWPALYFIDARGRLRHRHFGEGEYERSERTIQQLLAEAGALNVDAGIVPVDGIGVEAAADWKNLKSPELYLRYDRSENFTPSAGAALDRRRGYEAPPRLLLNRSALAGEWTMAHQAIVSSRAGGRIICRFHARDVHLVMGPQQPESRVRFRVSLDGQPPAAARGLDIDEEGNGTVVEQRLYQLIRQPKPIIDRTFEIEFLDAGVEALAFTFG